MVTTTTVYSFQKPDVSGDEDAWGGYLNANIDKYESILTGNTTITSLVITTADINGGTLDNVVIGGSTPAAITGTAITGTSFVSSGNMTFGDSNKAIFGAGSDLQIYHDGTDSYISDQGTGRIKILGDNETYIANAANGEYKARFITDGAVELYYDAAKKFETTSTGVDVTGTVTADGLTVETSGDPSALIRNTSTGTVSLTLRRSANDDAYTDWTFDNTGGNLSIISDDTTRPNATRIKMTYDGDISFYEDTGATAKLFWDASAESLGIGTTSPTASASGYNGATLHLSQSGSSNAGSQLHFTTGASGHTASDGGHISYWSNNDFYIYNAEAGNTRFYTNATERLRITSDGEVGINKSTIPNTSSSSYKTLVISNEEASKTSRFLAMGAASAYTSYASLTSGTHSGAVFYSPALMYTDTLRFFSAPLNNEPDDTNVTERMRLTTTGLGIGTSSISYPLDVRKNSTTDYVSSSTSAATPYVTGDSVISLTNATSTTNRGAFVSLGSTDAWGVTNVKYLGVVSQTGSYGGNFVIGGRTGSTSYKEHFRINSAGDVGVGTVSPSSWQSYRYLDVAGASSGQGGVIQIYTSGQEARGQWNVDSGGVRLQAVTNHNLSFHTNATQRMTIASYGSVGIGTSTPTNYSTYRYLDVVGSATNTGGVLQLLTSDLSANMLMYSSSAGGTLGTATNHNLSFLTNNSGKMVLDTSGNLLVGGTTSPSGSGQIVATGGVYLGGTGSANKLDDYETGTYSPTFVPASGSFTSIPFTSDGRFGRYTIVGNRCYFEIKLETASAGLVVGTASGAVYVSLPFTAATVTNYSYKAAATVSYSAYWSSQKNPQSADVYGGTSNLLLWHRATGTSLPSYLQVSDMDTTVGGWYNRVRLFGHYELA